MLPAAGLAQTPPPNPPLPSGDFTVERGTIKFAPGTNQARGAFLLKLTGDLANQSCQLGLVAQGVPDPPHIDLQLTAAGGTLSSNVRSWLVTVNVKAMPTVAQPTIRYFDATYCTYSKGLDYTLDNSFAGDFAWSVSALKPQRWNGTTPLPVSVSVGLRPATGVKLIAPQLIDKDSRAVQPGFVLCATRAQPCHGGPLTLAANTVHDLWIRRVSDATAPGAGEYTGNIRLVAIEKPAGDSFDTTLFVSDAKLQGLGAALILLGVVLSFVVVRLLRRGADRAALRKPVAILEGQLVKLRAEVEETERQTSRSFATLSRALDDAATQLGGIDQFLPSVLEFWAAPPELAPAQGGYQAFLTNGASTIGSLSIIFRQGILQVLPEIRSGRDPKQVSAAEAALTSLEALANGDLTKRDDIATKVRAILKDMADKLAALLQAAGSSDDAMSPTVSFSSDALSFQLVLMNIAGWSLFALLSALVGVYLLVINDPSFGKPEDLLLCLLWGFGLPIAGEGLTKLTPTGISQSLGMTVTRAPS